MEKKFKYLSASRIKTLKNCSWFYWCNYHLKVPQPNNSGAMRGTICHLVFELLLNKRHKKHYNQITKKECITASPAIDRLVIKHLKKDGIHDEENYTLTNKMIVTGLNHNFFTKGIKLFDPEYEFNIKNNEPIYNLYGFIDKWGIDHKNKKIEIFDYKSSKVKFNGDDLESNVQAMIYSLVSKKLYPDYEPSVTFIFLRFRKDPEQRVCFDKKTLEGFEFYLENVNDQINNFEYKDATSNFAADKRPEGKGFNGYLLCGRCSEKGELKKDGTPKWHCPYKFEQEYYAIVDKDKKTLKTSLVESELNPKEDESVEKRIYPGCPKFTKIGLTNF